MGHTKRMDAIRHPDVKVKHCVYGNRVAKLLNPCGIATVSHNTN
jgi:hypothetical protein